MSEAFAAPSTGGADTLACKTPSLTPVMALRPPLGVVRTTIVALSDKARFPCNRHSLVVSLLFPLPGGFNDGVQILEGRSPT